MQLLYLWIDGEGFVRLAHTQEVVDDLLHGEVQPFLLGPEERLSRNVCRMVRVWSGLRAYLSDELDDLDKDVEGSVPGHHTPGAFGEKC